MKILVTGATGLIGGAVARRLAQAGHEISALVRSDASAAKLAAQGYATMRGDLTSADVLGDAAAAADAVIHAASPGDASSAMADEVATGAILPALRGSSKRFIYTSGSLLYGATGDAPATEDSPLAPVDLVRFRKGVEARVLGAAAEGVHAIAIRPGWVYGHGGGTAMMMVASAAQHGAARYIGDGLNRWTTVHVDDLADLYRLALERAPAGAVFNGAHGEATPLIEIARAASVGGGAGGRIGSWPLEEARQTLGAFADAIACDQVVSGALAVSELGWRPTGPTILDELRSYTAKEA